MQFEKLNTKFLERLKQIYTKPDLEIIKSGFMTEKRNTTFRVNTLKSTNEDQESYLNSIWIKFEKINFLSNAYKLLDLNWYRVATLRWFETWEFYLQWITSQIPVEFMNVKEWMTVLDVSAAPWWKTSQLSAKLKNTWKIVANELNTIRKEKLKATVKKQGCSNVEIIWIDARKLDEKYKEESFDAILFDAPCSAEWRINLHQEKVYPNWSEENIKKNAKLQKEIIDKIIPLLKKWWEFIYSTCTLAPEENEEVVSYILWKFQNFEIQKIGLDYEFSRPWIVEFWWKKLDIKVSKTFRILPNKESEWFFVAKFKKIN